MKAIPGFNIFSNSDTRFSQKGKTLYRAISAGGVEGKMKKLFTNIELWYQFKPKIEPKLLQTSKKKKNQQNSTL